MSVNRPEMSSECRGSDGAQAAPVYTVYPGGNSGNYNYGFHQSNPQGPPPKYEDVINGRSGEYILPSQTARTYDLQDQPGAIFIAPVYKQTRIQWTLCLIFTILFAVGFISVLGKILSIPSNF